MKRMCLSLGLSAMILLSAAFAQNMQRSAKTASQTPAELMTLQTRTTLDAKKCAGKRPSTSMAKKSPTFQLQACYKSAKPSDKATIKLIVQSIEGDGSGFQVLLDSKHQLVDEFVDPDYGELDQEQIRDVYAAASNKIPADASPEVGTTSLVATDENPTVTDSVEVTPGTYDIFVTNPYEYSEKLTVYLAGYFDDMELEAGYTYAFNVVPGFFGGVVRFIPPINLVATEVTLPLINCGEEEAEVTLEISNEGLQTIDSCTVYYYLADIEEGEMIGDMVEERIGINLAFDTTYKHTFQTKVQFTEDTTIGIVAGISPVDGEFDENDNEVANIVVRQSAVEVPYQFEIENYDLAFDLNNWEMADLNGSTVLYNYTPLEAVTRCVTMEAGKTYRLTFDYMIGYAFFWEQTATLGVKFGKSGTDVATWDTIFLTEDAYIDDFVAGYVSVTPETAGEYAFAFFEDGSEEAGGGGIYLMNIAISNVLENDVWLKEFSLDMPTMMPVEHAEGKFQGQFTLVNWGSNNIDKATVTVSLKGQALATKEVSLGKTDTAVTETFEIELNGLNVVENLEFTAAATIVGDEDEDNNTIARGLKVTDAVMAYDFVTEDMYTSDYAIGVRTGNIGCGIPFTIAKKDTLTAVSIGWSQATDMPVGITIHKWNANDETLGSLMYETEVRRGTDAGQREYVIPAMVLESGSYIISAHQKGTFYGLICDQTATGLLYVTTNSPVTKQTNLGTPAIRAIFGHDGKPLAKDLAITAISQPKDLGLFTNEEPITVTVRSNGYEAAEGEVNILVNKTLLAAQDVKLDAYGQAEYTFKGDLSAADAEFVITAFVSLQGDEDTGNDTLTRTVHSLPAANPYVMNFEYCEDFAISGEFIPEWTSVDISEGSTYAYGWNLNYPHRQEVVGFMAWPSGAVTGLESYDGERFGLVNGVGDENDEAVQCNAWLISPKLKLTAENAKMSFYAKSAIGEYGLEKYNVMISTTDNKPESFAKVGETREAPDEDWEFVNVDLSDFAGKDVYVAIQHVSIDAMSFMIDAIVVGERVANESNSVAVRATVYPNPASEMILVNADQAIQQVAIFNLNGSLLYKSADNLNTEEFRYNVRGLNSGMYFARVKTAQGLAVVKFIVR